MLHVQLKVLLCIALHLSVINSFRHQSHHLPRFYSTSYSSVILHGSKHSGRYGSFIDTFPRPKNKKAEKLASEINLPDKTIQTQNGADLRRNRERNLRTYKENNPYDVIRVPEVPMNLPPETIFAIIKTLNLILNGKDRAELTDAERVGVINWSEFESISNIEIDGFETDLKFRKKLLSWTRYHIRKRDIVFKDNMWLWDNTRLRRHGRVRTAIVPRKPNKSVDFVENS